MASSLNLKSVGVVDDDPESRLGWAYSVEDADMEPVGIGGPIGTLQDFLQSGFNQDAVLSDFELRAKNYAEFTGAELVAALTLQGTPGVLCTSYEAVSIEKIRPHRRWIPCLLNPAELNPDSLIQGFELAQQEIAGRFTEIRKPRRTLVRFVEPDRDSMGKAYFIEVPGWSTAERLRVELSTLPTDVQRAVKPDFRCHSMVNLGAEDFNSLYLSDWQMP